MANRDALGGLVTANEFDRWFVGRPFRGGQRDMAVGEGTYFGIFPLDTRSHSSPACRCGISLVSPPLVFLSLVPSAAFPVDSTKLRSDS